MVELLRISNTIHSWNHKKNKPWFSTNPQFQGRFEKSKLAFDLLIFYYVQPRSVYLNPRFRLPNPGIERFVIHCSMFIYNTIFVCIMYNIILSTRMRTQYQMNQKLVKMKVEVVIKCPPSLMAFYQVLQYIYDPMYK